MMITYVNRYFIIIKLTINNIYKLSTIKIWTLVGFGRVTKNHYRQKNNHKHVYILLRCCQ